MSDVIDPEIANPKVIFHIDGDAFFVGVEVAKNPKLKGLPVVTGEERGIVTALSYEAKALGVVRGMSVHMVQKAYPSVLILPGDYRSYVEYSSKMFEIVNRYAYEIEEYSIDECFADFTGLDRTLQMSYRQIAEQIKKEIYEELGLSVSVGMAPTKVLAKIASNWVKPNGLTIIESATVEEYLAKVPIKKVWGIGPKTGDALLKYGVRTALDFRNKDIAWIARHFSKTYEIIWHELHERSLIKVDAEVKTSYSSIQKTRTFHPITNDESFLLSQLSKHIEDACKKARHYNLVPKKISIFLKTRDLKLVTSTIKLPEPSNSPEILMVLAHQQFKKIYSRTLLYRTAGVVLHDLEQDFISQDNLFETNLKAKKFAQIHKHIDSVEQKFGKRMVYLASTHDALLHKTSGTDADDMDKDLLFL